MNIGPTVMAIIAWLTGADRPPRRIARGVWAARRRKRITVPLSSIALLVLLLVVGVADVLYHPTATEVHGDGRESGGAAGTMPNLALGPAARLNSLTLPLRGTPAKVMIGADGPLCDDWRDRLPSDGHRDAWERLQRIEYIIVHNTGTSPAARADAQAVANYHVGKLGWEHTGYHVHVNRNGSCQWALPTEYTGYHAFTWNARSIAVVLESSGAYSVAQLATYRQVVAALMRAYRVPLTRVWGHRDTSEYDARNQATPWGQTITSRNDHVDPCAGSADCAWDTDKFGLVGYLASTGGAVDPAPAGATLPTTPLGADGRPDWRQAAKVAQYPGTVYSGQATWYRPTGARTASGEEYDGRALTTATYLVAAEADGRCRDGGRPNSWGACPAWPWGTWLAVESDGKRVAVRVNDTGGGFSAPHLLDLSPAAFRVLAPESVGRLRVTVTVLGRSQTSGTLRGFVPCGDGVNLGGWLTEPILSRWRSVGAGQTPQTVYGCPLDIEMQEVGGARQQRFARGIMTITENGHVVWQAGG